MSAKHRKLLLAKAKKQAIKDEEDREESTDEEITVSTSLSALRFDESDQSGDDESEILGMAMTEFRHGDRNNTQELHGIVDYSDAEGGAVGAEEISMTRSENKEKGRQKKKNSGRETREGRNYNGNDSRNIKYGIRRERCYRASDRRGQFAQ